VAASAEVRASFFMSFSQFRVPALPTSDQWRISFRIRCIHCVGTECLLDE
jgi:hypothetical protein